MKHALIDDEESKILGTLSTLNDTSTWCRGLTDKWVTLANFQQFFAETKYTKVTIV